MWSVDEGRAYDIRPSKLNYRTGVLPGADFIKFSFVYSGVSRLDGQCWDGGGGRWPAASGRNLTVKLLWKLVAENAPKYNIAKINASIKGYAQKTTNNSRVLRNSHVWIRECYAGSWKINKLAYGFGFFSSMHSWNCLDLGMSFQLLSTGCLRRPLIPETFTFGNRLVIWHCTDYWLTNKTIVQK